jgi:carbonic anhydrase/acetyltransferase-like protein (isoleucine patch superfamily)
VIRPLSGHAPEIGPGAFVHESAEVVGRVRLGTRASIWPRAVLRGDTERVEVGDETNVQDGAVLHADLGEPCLVGARVSVGHLACVHGCVVEDDVLVGIGAVLLNGVHVGTGSIVGAGAVVPEGTRVPARSLVLGVPGRVTRSLTPAEVRGLTERARRYVGLIEVHRGG